MKKSFLTLAAAASIILAGCTGKGGGKKGGGDGIPKVDGKTAFKLTLGEGTVEIPTWASIYVTGGFCEWGTDPDKCVAMTRLENTNTYYGYWDTLEAASTADKYYEFQATIGYAADSNAPSKGVNWSYKSDECKTASGESGLDNLTFTIKDGVVDLGTHTWKEAPAEPKVLKNLKIEAHFAEAVPEDVELFMPGNYANNWSCSVADDKMTPSADRKTFSMTVAEIAGNNYACKIIAEKKGVTEFTWANTILDDGAGDNYTLMVKATWGDNYTLNLNEQVDDETSADFTYDWDLVTKDAFYKLLKGYESDVEIDSIEGKITGEYKSIYNGSDSPFGNGMFLTNGETTIMYYNSGVVAAADLEALAVGDSVKIEHVTLTFYNGLIQVKAHKADEAKGLVDTTITKLENAVPANGAVVLTKMPSTRYDISKHVVVTGKVKSNPVEAAGTADKTMVITVDEGEGAFDINVFCKKNSKLDYTAISALTVGEEVTFDGFLAVYKSKATIANIDYADPAIWQIVAPVIRVAE